MIFEFKFPDIGEGIHEGRLLEWKCRPGDRVSEGGVIAVVETDKVVTDIPSPRTGVIAELGLAEGDTVEVGQVMVRIELDGGHIADADVPPGQEISGSEGADHIGVKARAAEREVTESVVGRLDGDVTVLPSQGGSGNGELSIPVNGKILATPVARRLASQKGVDIGRISGTGPKGRVLKADILKAAALDDSIPLPEASGMREAEDFHPLSTLRKTLARNMENSWKIPAAEIHDYTTVEDLAAIRQDINREADHHLSFLPFFIKFVAYCLEQVPILNSHYFPERQGYVTNRDINIGVAMDTEDGLVVPVVRNADKLSVAEIQTEVDRLQEGAINRSLGLSEIKDGSFTVTNFGSIGGSYGRPLILPPQVGILGLGRIQPSPVVVGDEVKVGKVLPLSLVVDHRLVDGADAVRFLNQFISCVSKPSALLAALR